MTVHFAPWALKLPDRLHLGARAVHLWAWEVDRDVGDATLLTTLLSPEELDRASGLRQARDRSRFVAARGMMRNLLARYAGCPGESLRFVYGPHGKPALSGRGPKFSLSRRDALAILAISESAAVGVDIERLAPAPDAAAILQENASPAEIDAYARLPEEGRAKSFFCWWTRKEAVVKAIGGGLSIPLSSFDVPIEAELADTPAGFVRRIGGVWTLRHLEPHAHYCGALALEGSLRTVKAWYLGRGWPGQP